MSETLLFGSTPVDIPVSGDPENWAPAVTEALEAISQTLATVAGAFDVPSQSIAIDSSNPGIPNTDIPPLNFPTTQVRAVNISYAVFRSTDSTTVYETGSMIAVYSPANPIGMSWELSRDYVGDAKITFNVTDTGQFQFTATAIAGTGHTGRITFAGKAILKV